MTMTEVAAPSTAEALLRKVLLANVEFSVTTGLAALIFGGSIADVIGVDQVWLVRLLGAGLLGFAAVVFWVSRSSTPALQRFSRDVSQADIGWVVGTVVVIALGWLSTAGVILMAVIAATVLALGVTQWRLRTRCLVAS